MSEASKMPARIWARLCGGVDACEDTKAEAAAVWNTRLAAGASAGAVKVKPLEWTTAPNGWFGEGAGFKYVVFPNTLRICVDLDGVGFVAWCDTDDEAKAAAQADYESRILSALTLEPVKAGDEVMLREALERVLLELEANAPGVAYDIAARALSTTAPQPDNGARLRRTLEPFAWRQIPAYEACNGTIWRTPDEARAESNRARADEGKESEGGVEGHAIPRTTSATTTRYPATEGEEHMVATARRTEERSSTKTGQAGIKPGPLDTHKKRNGDEQ